MSLSGLLMMLLFLLTLRLVEYDSRKLWVVYGLMWGVAALTNPALLSVLPLSLVWLVIKRRRQQKVYLVSLLLVLVTFVACVTPWIVRNRMVLGKATYVRITSGSSSIW